MEITIKLQGDGKITGVHVPEKSKISPEKKKGTTGNGGSKRPPAKTVSKTKPASEPARKKASASGAKNQSKPKGRVAK